MSEDVEAVIRARWEQGRFDEAVRATVEGYGPEIFGFLVSRTRDDDEAGDVFSQACEDLWRTMESFQWRCSMRTWMYKLARSAASRRARSPHNRAGRRVPLSQVSEVAERVRSRTLAHLRTEVKDEFTKLRETFSEEEQTILTLRVDRGLDWNEVARVLADEELDDDALGRASARLRQRFKKLKVQLRERAIAAGLIQPEG